MSLDNGDLKKVHGALPGLVDQLKEGKLDRREFLRMSTLLGLSASAAYALAGLSEPVQRGACGQRRRHDPLLDARHQDREPADLRLCL